MRAAAFPMSSPLPQPLSPEGTRDASIQEQLAFERMLAEIAARFASVPPEAVEAEIAAGMRRLIDFLGFDRSTLIEVLPDSGRLISLCSATVPGIEPIARGEMPAFPWYVRQLASGRPVAQTDLPESLPADALLEREFCARTGLRSNLTVPLRCQGEVRYCLAIGALRRTRTWPEALVDRLTLVGDVFVLALQRAQGEQRLKTALAELNALKDRLEAENVYLREVSRPRVPADALVSQSPAFLAATEEMRKVAPTKATVLLLGETGTGKERMAGAIHELSPRADRTMVKVNCAALPATLIEAELFGREKGAYTGALTRQVGRFELAEGGTILLDEVGDLPLELQPKLLRVLQEGELERVGGTKTIRVDVRVIAATNRDLRQAVRDGKFREDLYYRLNVFPIRLPPLRERAADIPMLVWQFVRELAETMGRPIERIPDEAMAAIVRYPWPGNVRELRNVLERAMILATDATLPVALPEHHDEPASPAPGRTAASATTLEQSERRQIEETLVQCGWRIRGESGAAARLGLKPTTLESRMRKLGISRPS
jgi:transcriptional regulator with GAF, ATPase, and Fis domain